MAIHLDGFFFPFCFHSLWSWLQYVSTLLFWIWRYYGGTLSEKVLGKALKALAVPRNEYIVATKCGRYKEGFDFSADRVTRSIEESLQRLQLDYVDILQCHDIEFGSLDQVGCSCSLYMTISYLESPIIWAYDDIDYEGFDSNTTNCLLSSQDRLLMKQFLPFRN